LLDEASVPLGAGDLIVMYTDGITEAMNAQGDYFGEPRLAALVEAHGDAPFEELRERILRDLDPVVVFTTTSDIEASVVTALLDSQGIASFRISGNPQAIWPMTVNSLGEIRI